MDNIQIGIMGSKFQGFKKHENISVEIETDDKSFKFDNCSLYRLGGTYDEYNSKKLVTEFYNLLIIGTTYIHSEYGRLSEEFIKDCIKNNLLVNIKYNNGNVHCTGKALTYMSGKAYYIFNVFNGVA